MTRRHHILLSLILLIGATLRFWHLDWGTDPVDGRFHPLHPDERSLLQAAAELRHDLKPTISSYVALSLYLPWLPATLFGFVAESSPFTSTIPPARARLNLSACTSCFALLGDRQALRLPNHTIHQGPVF